MTALEKVPTEIRRSRRNLIKVGAIAGAAVLASLTTPRLAAAGNGNGQGGNGQGGNGQGGNGQGGNGQGHAQCFLKGTNIRTAEGDRKVEDLSSGDLLPTVFEGICPIQWIGRYSLKKSDPTRAWVKKVLPVRVARSALGLDVPNADLYVTKEHALLIDDVLVTAGSLINGTTITVYDPRELDELEFFHIKLERHNAIYAEGAPCETMINVEESAVNFAEYLRKYGHPITQEPPCAPLLSCNSGRSEIRSRLRSAISPWIDRRQKLDIIRDELEERGIAVNQDRNSSRDCRVLA
jgi:Hint domain